MKYQKYMSAPLESQVNKALLKYKMTGDISAGWDILRYAKQGRLDWNPEFFSGLMSEWYPGNPDYVILRLAKMGKLYFKMTDQEKLAALEV